MPVGLGTRKCHRFPFLQEGSDDYCGLPEGRLPMKLGILQPPTPLFVLAVKVRGCQAVWWRSSWCLLDSNDIQLQEAEMQVSRPGSAAQHSRWVQYYVQQLLSSKSFLLSLEAKGWEWEILAETSSLTNAEPPTCFLHGQATQRTPCLPFRSLNLVLLYFHACR